MSTLAEALSRLLSVLDRLEIPYETGGSVAGSAHGVPRATLGVDIVVDLRPWQIDDFAAGLSSEFYVDTAMIREAFVHGRAVNLIHLESAWKFDLFPLQTDDYSRAEFARRSYRQIRPDADLTKEALECAVAPSKIRFCASSSGIVSERQCNDLRGLCTVAKGSLDLGYLRRWAGHLGVGDPLERVLAECEAPN